MLLYKENKDSDPFYRMILSKNNYGFFLEGVFNNSIKGDWKEDKELLVYLLEDWDRNKLKNNLPFLCNSKISLFRKVGKLLNSSLTDSSISSLLQKYFNLKKILPSINISLFSKFIFKESIYSKITKGLSNIKALQFSTASEVFTDGKIMAGVFQISATLQGRRFPPFLVGFDTERKKVVWERPLWSKGIYRLLPHTLDKTFTLQYFGSSFVEIIDIASGKKIKEVNTCFPLARTSDYLHFGVLDSCFFRKIVCEQAKLYHSLFFINTKTGNVFSHYYLPKGGKDILLSLETHLGILNSEEKILHIANVKTVDTLLDCTSVVVNQGRALLIEGRKLTERFLLNDSQNVISQKVKSLYLQEKNVYLEALCDNGVAILYKRNLGYRKYFFFNAETWKKIPGEYDVPLDAQTKIDRRRGAIWVFQPNEIIKKITINGMEFTYQTTKNWKEELIEIGGNGTFYMSNRDEEVTPF